MRGTFAGLAGEQIVASLQRVGVTGLFLGYFIPWFLDRPQTVGLQAFSQTLDYNTFVGAGSEDYERSSEGVTLTYGRSFRLFQSFAVSYTLASFEERYGILPEGGDETTTFLTRSIDSSSVRPVWSYNSIDNRFEPTRGMRLSLSGEYSGGFQNMLITGPDGKTYTFSLRPLLPDEKA